MSAVKERLEARIGKEQKVILQRAADLSGRSLSDFIIAASYREAVETIQKHEVTSLSVADSVRFAEAVLGDAPPAPELKEAADWYKRVTQ